MIQCEYIDFYNTIKKQGKFSQICTSKILCCTNIMFVQHNIQHQSHLIAQLHANQPYASYHLEIWRVFIW